MITKFSDLTTITILRVRNLSRALLGGSFVPSGINEVTQRYSAGGSAGGSAGLEDPIKNSGVQQGMLGGRVQLQLVTKKYTQ